MEPILKKEKKIKNTQSAALYKTKTLQGVTYDMFSGYALKKACFRTKYVKEDVYDLFPDVYKYSRCRKSMRVIYWWLRV
jgi:hypothetical protein